MKNNVKIQDDSQSCQTCVSGSVFRPKNGYELLSTDVQNSPSPAIDGNNMLAVVLPDWLESCPLVSGWCRYNGRIFYADLNWEESQKAEKPIFDLAYCATKAMNNIYLLRREWDAKKFRRWEKHSNW